MHDGLLVAAVLLRPGEPDEPALVQLAGPVSVPLQPGCTLRLLVAGLPPALRDVLGQPRPEPLAERGLLGRVAEIHGGEILPGGRFARESG